MRVGALTCYVCGLAATPNPGRGVPVCVRCEASGDQLPKTRIRWMAMDAEGRAHGPLPREGLVERLAQGVLNEESLVSRQGGDWAAFCEHPDLRGAFLPGHELYALRTERLDEGQSARKAVTRAKLRGRALAAVALIGAGAFGAWTATTGGLVLPESWTSGIVERLSSAGRSVGDQVSLAVDQDAALELVKARRGLPGQEHIDELQARFSESRIPTNRAVVDARSLLWRGSEAEVERAVEMLAEAVSRAPDDPEVTGTYTEALAWSLPRHPDRTAAVTGMMERTDELAPGSLAALRAGAMLAWKDDVTTTAEGLAVRCVGLAEGKADPTCLLVKGVVTEDLALLRELDARLGGRWPVRYELTRGAVAAQEWKLVEEAATAMVVQRPEVALPHALLAQAAKARGDWGTARSEGLAAAELDGGALEARYLAASIRFKALGDLPGALEEYEALVAHQAAKEHPTQILALVDAATIAWHLGDADKAEALARRATELQPGVAGAQLVLAELLFARDEAPEAEQALKAAKLDALSPRAAARFEVAASRLHRQVHRDRSARMELDKALEHDPSWTDLHLESASLAMALGDLQGAADTVRNLVFTDPFVEEGRTPLVELWVAPFDRKTLRAELDVALNDDIRLQPDAEEVLAIMDFLSRSPRAGPALEEVLRRRQPVPTVSAALAQQRASEGRWAEVLPHAQLVLSLRSGAPLFLALEGRALQEAGRQAEADEAFRRAGLEDSRTSTVHRIIAEARQASGNLDLAGAELRAALLLQPDDLVARTSLLALPEAHR